MKRTLLSYFFALAVICFSAASALPVMAQTPVASPAATDTSFMLPINHLLLRIRDGNGYGYMRDPSGGHLAYENIHIIRNGEMPDDMPPALEELYVDLGMRDMYFMTAVIWPVDAPAGLIGEFGITIETRLITVADADAAARLVDIYPQILVAQAPDPQIAESIVLMENLPAQDGAIVGVTGLDPYYFLATGEPSGHQVPYARLIAQHGATVASVKVTSLDPAFNDAVARQLLDAQLACVEANSFCVPVPIAEGTSYVPGTPVASPAAVTPHERSAVRRPA